MRPAMAFRGMMYHDTPGEQVGRAEDSPLSSKGRQMAP